MRTLSRRTGAGGRIWLLTTRAARAVRRHHAFTVPGVALAALLLLAHLSAQWQFAAGSEQRTNPVLLYPTVAAQRTHTCSQLIMCLFFYPWAILTWAVVRGDFQSGNQSTEPARPASWTARICHLAYFAPISLVMLMMAFGYDQLIVDERGRVFFSKIYPFLVTERRVLQPEAIKWLEYHSRKDGGTVSSLRFQGDGGSTLLQMNYLMNRQTAERIATHLGRPLEVVEK